MHIESVPIERINPAVYNPRIDLQPGDRDYDRLQRSMDEFGFVEPLVWNRRTGNLVGGHHVGAGNDRDSRPVQSGDQLSGGSPNRGQADRIFGDAAD